MESNLEPLLVDESILEKADQLESMFQRVKEDLNSIEAYHAQLKSQNEYRKQ